MAAVRDLQLKSNRFRAEREADWRRLESLLGRAEGGHAARLTDEELLEIPVLYRSAMSSLSVARATSLDSSLVEYLESLGTRAYFFVYGPRTQFRERIVRFFRDDWPAAVRGLWRETLVAAAIFAVATVAGYFLVTHDPDWYNSIMPGEMAQGRDPTASTAHLRSILYDSHGGDGLSAFATFLFTHNAQVSIMEFALGFAFGLPTAIFDAYEGLTLGALYALYDSRGLGFELGGWLSIHGATEIFAGVLAGAAGFHIGWAMAFPGDRPRLEAAAKAGRAAAAVMAGVVVMLIFAGLLEGIGRQLITVDAVRYGIGGIMLMLWLGYFYLPRPRRAAA